MPGLACAKLPNLTAFCSGSVPAFDAGFITPEQIPNENLYTDLLRFRRFCAGQAPPLRFYGFPGSLREAASALAENKVKKTTAVTADIKAGQSQIGCQSCMLSPRDSASW